MPTEKIATLMDCQLRDPQRGPFRVNVGLCKQPRYFRGERVHVDGTGERFVIAPGSAQAQIPVAS